MSSSGGQSADDDNAQKKEKVRPRGFTKKKSLVSSIKMSPVSYLQGCRVSSYSKVNYELSVQCCPRRALHFLLVTQPLSVTVIIYGQ